MANKSRSKRRIVAAVIATLALAPAAGAVVVAAVSGSGDSSVNTAYYQGKAP